MPKQSRLSISAPRAGAWRLPLALLTLAGCILYGVAAVWLREHASASHGLFSTALALTALAAVAQIRTASVVWKSQCGSAAANSQGVDNPFAGSSFWIRLFTGLVFVYIASLLVGGAGASHFFLASAAWWCTLLLLPLATKRETREQWRRWAQSRTSRRVGWLLFAGALAAVTTELSLRAREWIASSANPNTRLAEEFGDANPTSVAWREGIDRGDGMPARPANQGEFRVAILVSELASDSAASDDYQRQLKALLPGLKLANYRLPPNRCGTEMERAIAQVASTRPDLVLALFSVGADVAAEEHAPGPFDSQGLCIVRLVARLFGRQQAPMSQSAASPSDQHDSQAFLQTNGSQLAVCRAPMDDAMRARWKRTLCNLDGVVAECRKRRLPLALVVVPCEYQVNDQLLQTIRRRHGYEPKDLDLELPQRRLATYAHERRVPMLDLLPHLRLCEESPYRFHDAAWNERGHEAAAEAIGGWLESRYGVALAATAQLSSKR